MNDISKAYNSTSLKANYLISTGLSNAGAIFCNYGSQNRYTHGKSIAAYETIETSRDHDEPPGQQVRLEAPHMGIRVTGRYLLPAGAVPLRILRPRAGHRLHPLLFVVASGDEALLNRAEAYIMKRTIRPPWPT